MKATLYLGDCLDIAPTPKGVDAVVSDPPYGMGWNTDSTRFSGSPNNPYGQHFKRGLGRDDWGAIDGDSKPFDPSPWLGFPRVILWGANHYAQRLPVGTTLVWIKKPDHLFATFLSDAEIGWQKGGHGVYCHRALFPPPTRMAESHTGGCLHPAQKPLSLMGWCIERLTLDKGSTILDPYMGSGTTGVAALRLGMNFIGIEKEPRYFDAAVRRIKSDAPMFHTVEVVR